MIISTCCYLNSTFIYKPFISWNNLFHDFHQVVRIYRVKFHIFHLTDILQKPLHTAFLRLHHFFISKEYGFIHFKIQICDHIFDRFLIKEFDIDDHVPSPRFIPVFSILQQICQSEIASLLLVSPLPFFDFHIIMYKNRHFSL